MKAEQAEVVALQALAWIIGNDDLRDVFMGASGVTTDDLRNRAGEADFQGSVLGFLLMTDEWVIGFCDDHGLPYETPYQAQQSLPGQGEVHWT